LSLTELDTEGGIFLPMNTGAKPILPALARMACPPKVGRRFATIAAGYKISL
jgi:hypothetical protein